MEDPLANFILGMAMGIGLHRYVMYFVLGCCPDTRCAYCKWLHMTHLNLILEVLLGFVLGLLTAYFFKL